jgi:serine/threonine protein kinase
LAALGLLGAAKRLKFRKRKKGRLGAPLLCLDGASGPIAFERAQLEDATDGFADHRKIGEGTFGTVFRSDALISDRAVAIKVFKPETAAKVVDCAEEWSGTGAFRKELEVLGKCRHPNIVELIGFCQDDDSNQSSPGDGCLPFKRAAEAKVPQLCLVFEFMAGDSLGTRLRAARDNRSAAAPLSCAERFDIASDVARGVEYLHTEVDPPIIHQDVKSDNVLLCYFQGRLVAKVADFGTVRFVPALLEEEKRGVWGTHHSTQNVIGTRPYMPSEYTHFGHVSEKTDAFAFGVVLCELLTGLPPADHDAGEMLATTMPQVLADAERLLPPLLDKRIGGGGSVWPPLQAAALGRVAAQCIEPRVSARCTIADVRPELDVLAGREGQTCGRGDLATRNPRLVSNERGVRLAHDTASMQRPLVPDCSVQTGKGDERKLPENDTLGYQANCQLPALGTVEQTDGGRPIVSSNPRIVSNERGVRLAHDTASMERPLVPPNNSPRSSSGQ